MGYDDICMAADELQAQFGVTRSVRCDVEQVQIHHGTKGKRPKQQRQEGQKAQRAKGRRQKGKGHLSIGPSEAPGQCT